MTNNVQAWLQTARERKAQEILFNPSQSPKLRVGKDFINLQSPQMTAAETRNLISTILTDEEKTNLYENLKIQGARTLGGVAFKFDFQIDFEGVNGSIELQSGAWAQWTFPQITAEVVARTEGLHLLIGSRRSGKTTAIQNILSSVQGRKKVIACYGDDSSVFSSDGNVLSQFSMEQLKTNGVLRSADIVVMDTSDISICETALQLAEEGRSVLLTLPMWNIQMGLQRFLDLISGTPDSRARRLASTLQMAMGLCLCSGIETPLQGAFELLIAEKDVQAMLASQKYSDLPGLMQSKAEKTGMRSMNQALFQLLIKRKIELKTAFECSPAPEELDALLKKVGI